MECEQAVCKMVVGSVEGHVRGTEEGLLRGTLSRPPGFLTLKEWVTRNGD